MDRKHGFWIVSFALLLTVSVAGAVVATTLGRGGPIRVEVRGKGSGGDDVRICLPGSALAACLPFISDEVFSKIPDDAVRHLGAARAFARLAAEKEDFVLVDRVEEGESVRVEKKGDALVVRIESEDETAFVSVPIWVLDRVVRKLESAS
jgi:hypothetical protein